MNCTDPVRSPATEEQRNNTALSPSEWETISGYRELVKLLYTIMTQLDKAQRYRLPMFKLQEEERQLKAEISHFETIMDRIQDRMMRIVLRCHFALGFSIRDTADILNISTWTVNTILHHAKPQ